MSRGTRVGAVMRCRATIEIRVDSWGADAKMSELHDIVKREGRQKIENAIREHAGHIIGELTMVGVTFEEER